MRITLRALCDDNQAIEEDGALVGMIASFTVEGDRELTYWIDPARWGHDIATTAVQVLIRREGRRPLHARAAAHDLGSAEARLPPPEGDIVIAPALRHMRTLLDG